MGNLGKQQVRSRQVPNIGHRKSIFQESKFPPVVQNVADTSATTDLSEYRKPKTGEMIANVMGNLSQSNSSPPPSYMEGKQLQVPRRQQGEAHIAPVHQLKAPPRSGVSTVDMVQRKTNEFTHLAQEDSKYENYSTGTITNPIVQRVIKGNDPLENRILEPGNENDLLYGLTEYRGTTIKRIKESARQDNKPEIENRKMTIDDYNKAVGITEAISLYPLMGIYTVRKALEDPKKWKQYLSNSQHDYPKEEEGVHISNEQKWMKFLVDEREKIGLFDLGNRTPQGRKFLILPGEATGLKLIKSKKRFEKNIDENFNKELTEKLVHKLLSYGTDYETALKKFSELNKRNNQLAQDVNTWVQNAFWRRTSKLGIDFATTESGLDARVHFNLTSGRRNDRGWSPVPGGIIKDVEEDRGKRKITESEWRYAQKLIRNDPSLKERILEYSEYE
ncbi:hypothetical protein [Okeania sp. SIO2B3]|uniref:hypothetical protein n=1 Tax=Okeania sp. SIO2B3 TaxID=2607784 RepID=UPI0013C032D8|nr:hypothetical protein [Okeania sp. SIO2B3]NET44175.1 hypothetical protein [Okeania sp. SIO2B3]